MFPEHHLSSFARNANHLIGAGAHAASCSLANAAGEWGFSYSGKALTTSGPAPLASSGYYSEDASGNMSGTETALRAPAKQARSVRQHFLTESHKPECSHLRR